MNEFFKLLRDFIIFIPLAVLIFGIFFTLIAVANENLALLSVGLLIALYGLIASYIRQIYKDYLNFLRKGDPSNGADYITKWKKYHCCYYTAQFILLGVFIYILWRLMLAIWLGTVAISMPSPKVISIPFWQDFEFWSVVVLATTVFFLIRYTRATEKLAEYQVMPAVEVNMIYDKNQKKTYFWFSNASNIPAFITIKAEVKRGNKKKEQQIGPLRIPPSNPHYYEFRKTATAFEFLEENSTDQTEITLGITVSPAFKKNKIKFNFIKSYRFNSSESQWDETSWGYPDPSFPHKQ